MLKWFKDTTKKSRAAVIVQNLVEMVPGAFMIPGGPAKFANSLVEDVWSADPCMFDGRKGPKPHHISIAAIALVRGMSVYSDSVVLHSTCKGALGYLLMDMEKIGFNYSLNGTDHLLLNGARERYNESGWIELRTHALPETTDAQLKTQDSKPPPENDRNPPDPVLHQRKMELKARLEAFEK
jgi:hypothetical protein